MNEKLNNVHPAKEMETNDFKPLPMKYSVDSITTHTLYIKQHAVREKSANKPTERTLFVLNIPPFVDENFLKNLFSKAGEVDHVELFDKPTSADKKEDNLLNKKSKIGFKVSYVIYKNAAGLQKALQLRDLKPTDVAPSSNNGVMKWIEDYNNSIPNVKELKQKIDNYMKNYDEECNARIEKEKAATEADDEGWTTVTKQGRKPGFERKESVTHKIATAKNERQQKKELKNFYTFQIRESKMNHVIALRQKFEEDKKKIALLKQSRRFKPF